MSLDQYLTAQETADEIGISYHLLMARIRKGLIQVEKKGWATLIHIDEVKKAKAYQRELEHSREAD